MSIKPMTRKVYDKTKKELTKKLESGEITFPEFITKIGELVGNHFNPKWKVHLKASSEVLAKKIINVSGGTDSNDSN